jgi:peptidoglycan/xylan/chitin deacetylase (PgdA/CDA1 family)
MTATSWLAHAGNAALGRRYPFVLCYHGVGSVGAGADPEKIFLSTELFEHHLEVIAGQGYELLSVGELWRQMRSDVGAAGKGSITFDDGLTRTTRHAIPLLLERGIGCSLFVPTGLLGKTHPDAPSESIATAQEIKELAAAGVEIGAHSVDHVDLARMSYAQALDQMRRSREMLEDLLGKPVTTMAYPFGSASADTVRAAREAGYELACACSGPGEWLPWMLPREPVYATSSPVRLRLKMAGLYGPVHALGGARRTLRRRVGRAESSR